MGLAQFGEGSQPLFARMRRCEHVPQRLLLTSRQNDMSREPLWPRFKLLLSL